jgi:hypothetical protein
MVIGYGRGNGSDASGVDPVMLGSIDSDNIRLFYNLEAYPYAFEADIDAVQWLCCMADESPTARAMLRRAQGAGWQIQLGNITQGGYSIDRESRIITLDHFGFTANGLGRSSHFRNMLLMTFIKSLREIWQERKIKMATATYRPDALMMMHRAFAADRETIALLVGWELRAAGHNEVWRYILGSEEGDMAMIFTRAPFVNGTATRRGSRPPTTIFWNRWMRVLRTHKALKPSGTARSARTTSKRFRTYRAAGRI